MLEMRAVGARRRARNPAAAFGDERGFFSETWSEAAWREAGHRPRLRPGQSFAFARSAGVLRGLHFQVPPVAQDKLVRVSRGAVFDVAVDIRQGSPTFGQWVGR